MTSCRNVLRSALDRACGGSAKLARIGRVPLALGAVLLVGSTVTVLATTNTPPQITTLTISPAVANEGQTVTITGTFTDPDPADLHSVLIYWPVVPHTQAEHVRLAPGARSFQVTHTFPDDLPPTSFHVYVLDHQGPFGSNDNVPGGGRDGRTLSLQVRNVAPTFAPGVTVTGPSARTGFTTIDGTLVDPGADRIAVVAAWGDEPAPPPAPFPPPPPHTSPCTVDDRGRQFHCMHTYNLGQLNLPREYRVTVGARDDDGGQGIFTTTVPTR